VSTSILSEPEDEVLKYQADVRNPVWSGFTKYCQKKNIFFIEDLARPPIGIKKMLADPAWLEKIKTFFNNKRARATQ